MEAFLNNLFGAAIAPERRLAVFILPDRRARHFSSLAGAALFMADEAAGKDVYFGIGLAGSRFGCRNSSEDIVALPGLWADVDCAAPRRPGKPLPPSVEDAAALVGLLPLAPSLLVHSGFGLHAYWLFKEPWVFESGDERAAAERLSKGWHGRVCALAEGFGWKLENVGDLARVLRPPGTFNHKADPPVEVCVLEEHADRRYNPSDFEEFVVAVPPAAVPEAQDPIGLILRPDAEPPAEKFAALLETCPAFAGAWERRRPDLSDQSQSAYDLSLADIAALNGWADAEIADLLIAARRKHGRKPEKALREDYIGRTIAAARRMAAERAAAAVDLSGLIVPKTDEGPRSLRQLLTTFPALRPPVIEGLLREGETMNVISAPKIGKSWLVIDLALTVAVGGEWLGFRCVPGDVLILDNELHGETSANRIPRVAAARGIALERVVDRIHVENLRGRLQDLSALGPYFRKFPPGRFRLVILDAFYRFLPVKADENDNGTMAGLYNCIDRFADHLKCCFVLIHHTSKGNQSLKDITDVGAGAGAQSRATDTHLILRRHEEDDAVVLEAAVRSWPPVPPRCLRWAFPVWTPADELDPAQLKQEGRRRSAAAADDAPDDPQAPEWTPRSFVEAFVGDEPKLKAAILVEANEQGIKDHKAEGFLEKAEAVGLVHRWGLEHNRTGFARAPPPSEPEPHAESDGAPDRRQAVIDMLRSDPDLSTREIAERCGVSMRWVQRVKSELEAN